MTCEKLTSDATARHTQDCAIRDRIADAPFPLLFPSQRSEGAFRSIARVAAYMSSTERFAPRCPNWTPALAAARLGKFSRWFLDAKNDCIVDAADPIEFRRPPMAHRTAVAHRTTRAVTTADIPAVKRPTFAHVGKIKQRTQRSDWSRQNGSLWSHDLQRFEVVL